MKRLFRLAIMITARVSLLLAVVLWVVSNWWGVTGTGDIMKWSLRVVNCQKGVAFAWADTGMFRWRFEVLTPAEVIEANWVFEPSTADLRDFDRSEPLPGLLFLKGSPLGRMPGRGFISIRHATLSGILALIYAALEFASWRLRRKQSGTHRSVWPRKNTKKDEKLV